MYRASAAVPALSMSGIGGRQTAKLVSVRVSLRLWECFNRPRGLRGEVGAFSPRKLSSAARVESDFPLVLGLVDLFSYARARGRLMWTVEGF